MGKLLLLGYFGAGNLGDDALLADWLKRWSSQLLASQLKCDVCSSGHPVLAGFAESAELETHIGRERGKRALLTANPRQYSALIMPGGSVLQNATSTRSLLFYLWVIWRFTSAGVPVYMLGQGLGPLKGNLANNLSALVLSKVQLLALRDQRSYDWAVASLGPPGREGVMLASDPVLAGRLNPAGSVLENQPLPGIVFVPKHRGDPEWKAQEQLLADIENLTGDSIEVLPFHPQDARLAEGLRAVVGSTLNPYEPTPEFLEILSNAKLVISYRLHGVILAAAYGVPALGVAYDRKVSAFCEEMRLPYCTPQDVIDGKAIELVRDLWHNREQVKATMIERRAIALKRLEAAEARFAELMWGAR